MMYVYNLHRFRSIGARKATSADYRPVCSMYVRMSNMTVSMLSAFHPPWSAFFNSSRVSWWKREGRNLERGMLLIGRFPCPGAPRLQWSTGKSQKSSVADLHSGKREQSFTKKEPGICDLSMILRFSGPAIFFLHSPSFFNFHNWF